LAYFRFRLLPYFPNPSAKQLPLFTAAMQFSTRKKEEKQNRTLEFGFEKVEMLGGVQKGVCVWLGQQNCFSAAVVAAFVAAIPLCRRKYSIFNFHFDGQQKLASENKGREQRAERENLLSASSEREEEVHQKGMPNGRNQFNYYVFIGFSPLLSALLLCQVMKVCCKLAVRAT